MTPHERIAVSQALAGDHAYIGIQPADATNGAPAFMLGAHTAASFEYEFACAKLMWPKCSDWALIAADSIDEQQSPQPSATGNPAPPKANLQPTARKFLGAVTIATFTT